MTMASPDKASPDSAVHRQVSVSAPDLASEDDAAVLGEGSTADTEVEKPLILTFYIAKLGYKQELRRNFSMIEVFGIAFSIMGLLPSIASTLTYSIPAGSVGMVWVSGCSLHSWISECGCTEN